MKTVIVVDDELITRMDISEMLVEAGYNVVASGADGFDAVELSRSHKPDLVLMDIKMPLFDGVSAAETIINEHTAGCVILLTAFADEDFVESAKKIGVNGYLTKPIDSRTLIPAVEVALEQSKRYRKALEDISEAKQKLEEKNTIDKAKIALAKKEGIQEGEAYSIIQKMAMDKSVTMAKIAESILGFDDEKAIVDKAKALLMNQNKIDESTAYRQIKKISNSTGKSIYQTAKAIISGEL